MTAKFPDKQQIQEMVQVFCKMMFFAKYSPENFEGMKITLKEAAGDWRLAATLPDDSFRRDDYALVLDFPKMPKEATDGVIVLSGFLTERLVNFFAHKKAMAARAPEARRAAAKKAIGTRWHKS